MHYGFSPPPPPPPPLFFFFLHASAPEATRRHVKGSFGALHRQLRDKSGGESRALKRVAQRNLHKRQTTKMRFHPEMTFKTRDPCIRGEQRSRQGKHHTRVLLVADGENKRKQNCFQGRCRSEPSEEFYLFILFQIWSEKFQNSCLAATLTRQLEQWI